MIIPFLLIFLGLILILVEFYLPGGIIGILGGISIVSGIILFASETSSLIALLLFIVGTAVAVGFVIQFAIWRIKHTKPQYSIYSSADQEGYVASTYDKSLVGKTGIVSTDLKPGGYIVVEGKQHPAISLSGYISKGEHVLIVGGQEQSLMVNLMKKEPS